ADGRYSAIVSAPAALLDTLAAQLTDSLIELIIDADDSERIAALAIATSDFIGALRVADVAADKNAARPRQLSDEVSRIATTIARLSTGPSTAPRPVEAAPDVDLPSVSAETIR